MFFRTDAFSKHLSSILCLFHIKFKHFERGKGKKIKNMKNKIYAKVVGKIDPKEHLSWKKSWFLENKARHHPQSKILSTILSFPKF